MASFSVAVVGRPPVRRQTLWRYWRGGLQGSEFTWAVAFVVPYIAVFFAFVVYPAGYGLWMGSNPSLYAEVFSDPIYLNTVVNTLVFLARSEEHTSELQSQSNLVCRLLLEI